MEVRDESNQVALNQDALKVPRGDIDLTILLLADAESKGVDIPAQEKGHRLAAEEPQSAIRSSIFGKPKKALSSVALGNALTGMHCFPIAPRINVLGMGRPVNIWFNLICLRVHKRQWLTSFT